MKLKHSIGAIFIVSGTTIGAGMLGMPPATGYIGFIPAIIAFIVCWLIMLVSAYFFLDVNLSIKGEVNLISMSRHTLGIGGQALSWVCYLLLLYTLTAAYIAGSAPLFQSLIEFLFHRSLPNWLSFFALPCLFGGFVYLGTLGVDLINRLLIVGLILSYLLLTGFLPKHLDLALLSYINFKPMLLALPLIIAAFGYHIVIPSLTTYLQHDRKKLRRILLIGSLLPLVIYVLWELFVLGIVPLEGRFSLSQAWINGQSATYPLTHIITTPWIKTGASCFAFFAITTSFLGVTLSLSDFLTDGFKIKKSWEGRLLAFLLTFVPPLIFVFTYPQGFLIALNYAGALVAILLIFLPSLMAWQLKHSRFYQSIGGRILFVSIILFSILIVASVILQQIGLLTPFTF